jgi:hypothetical protein
MSTDKKNNEEEVDLGSLFVIIGRGFSKLFNFIGKIFKGVFHFIIEILLFLKKHQLKLAIAALIGGIIGGILEYKKGDRYASDLILQPNFNSARQLYNNINYYDDLVKQKDTILLAKIFDISLKDAASLKDFEILPIKTENDILTDYDKLTQSVDTLIVKSYSYRQFKTMFTNYDYKFHKVTVEASKKRVFSNLDNVILSSIVENEFFDKLKNLTNENLNRTDLLLRKNLAQLDSLNKVYMKVMLDEAKKESNGTNIDLGGEKRTTKELEIFETNRRINNDLKKITEDKSEKTEVINVISNFQPVGYEVKGIEKNEIFRVALLGISVMIFFLLLKMLNGYLDRYKI